MRSIVSWIVLVGLATVLGSGCVRTQAAEQTPEVALAGEAQAPSSVPPTPQTEQPVATSAPTETPPTETPFRLDPAQHPWARFQPGAWREIEIVTETFREDGESVSRHLTTQREVLEAASQEKYVLRLQATVDLVGKRIVGAWKTRVLYLATDGADPILGSRQLENRVLPLKGLTSALDCQVWEVDCRGDKRNLQETLYYDSAHYPFVLKRETVATPLDPELGLGEQATVQQTIEVVALEMPYRLGKQMQSCVCLRTKRHRSKGTTVQLAICHPSVPGGEVAVWSTEFDTEGKRVGWSATTLLDYGEDPSEIEGFQESSVQE